MDGTNTESRQPTADSRQPTAGLCTLTAAESQVLAELAEEYTHREVAKRLFMSPNTVKSHVARIRKKLGVHSTKEAAHIYRAEKITPLGG